MNLEPGAYTVCGLGTDPIEMRQRELGNFRSFGHFGTGELDVLTRANWWSGSSFPSTYTIAPSETDDGRRGPSST